jgi:hypothetical protein
MENNQGGRWDRDEIEAPEPERPEDGGGVCGCIATILLFMLIGGAALAAWFLSGR